MLVTPTRTPEAAPTSAPIPATISGPVPTPLLTAPKITRGHSCVLCQQRKVKCDRQKPCSNCIKARAECVVAAPSLPRRRRRKAPEGDLVTKLRKYEQLLKSHGIKVEGESQPESSNRNRHGGVEEIDVSDMRRLTMSVPRAEDAIKGTLFYDKDKSQYVENTLWENLRDEMGDPQGSSEDDIDDMGLYPEPESILMGFGDGPSKDLSSFHPPVVHIFRLWQIYLENVNPLVKMFHAPTVQQMILEASGNVSNISKPNEALIFTIYFLAVTSLTNPECETMFGESRQKLLSKYAQVSQQALINARFLKSLNLTTLQALVQFLLGARRIYDVNTLWILGGVSVRIAQRLGIHRENTSGQISPFDAEMRRRTYWQIVFNDGHASKLAGAGFPTHPIFDTNHPRNLNDSDLNPSMKELPPNKEGITEMLFWVMRSEVIKAMQTSGLVRSFLAPGGPPPDLLADKDAAIAALENNFNERFIKYCDPSIPLHLLVIYIAKSVICTMRIMAHHPRQYPDNGANMPQSERDLVFRDSLTELEIDSRGHKTPSVQGYLWHVHQYFQIDAFIYVISELRTRVTGDLADRAWAQVEESFSLRPEMINDYKNSLFFAIGNLTLKAWTKREEATDQYLVPPRYISILRLQRKIPEPPRPPPNFQDQDLLQDEDRINYNIPSHLTATNEIVPSWDIEMTTFEMPMPEVTPADWEYWQTLMDGDLPAFVAEPTGPGWI